MKEIEYQSERRRRNRKISAGILLSGVITFAGAAYSHKQELDTHIASEIQKQHLVYPDNIADDNFNQKMREIKLDYTDSLPVQIATGLSDAITVTGMVLCISNRREKKHKKY